jgi:hypothetical protein
MLALLNVATLAGHQPGRIARAVIGAAALALFLSGSMRDQTGRYGPRRQARGEHRPRASWTSWEALLTGTFTGFALTAIYGGASRHATGKPHRPLPLGLFVLLGTLMAIAFLGVIKSPAPRPPNLCSAPDRPPRRPSSEASGCYPRMPGMVSLRCWLLGCGLRGFQG